MTSFDAAIWIVAILSLTVGAVALALSALVYIRHRDVGTRLSELVGDGKMPGDVLETVAGWVERLGRRLASENARTREVRDLLTKAGFFRPAALYIFVVVRIVFAIATGLVFLAWFGPTNINLGIGVILSVLCYRYALIGVKYLGERRARRIQRELPSVLDIILMVLDSGVSIDQCLHYVAGVIKGSAPTTAVVFTRHIADLDSGVPYDVALDKLGQRLAVDEGIDFANLLKQAIFHGGELGVSIRRFAGDLADGRLALARDTAGRRSTYLTIVLVLFFVPVLLVILMGPAAVRIGETLVAAGHRVHSSEIRAK